MVISPQQGIDEHVGLLVRRDIAAYRLAEDGGVAIDIEQVVLQLESQSYLFAILIEMSCIFVAGTSQYSPHLHGTGQQDAGLQTYHFKIFSLCDIIAVLELHVILLSFSYFEGRLGEKREYLVLGAGQ